LIYVTLLALFSPRLKTTPARSAGALPRRRSGASREPAVPAIRRVRKTDLDRIIAIDATVTGLEKRGYWQSLYIRYGVAGRAERHFLVAEAAGRVVGFVIGEVRDWEFGSEPCGWVFGIDVDPGYRLHGVGTHLLDAICTGFRRAGVRKVRTLLSRDNTLILSFFRSQGMMAGPFIPLEMDIDG
jgi:ribosomal protein S18 acetylase RimI-like enzyme